MKKYLASVASVVGYDDADNEVFTGYTLTDSSLENALSNTDVRGGEGNKLQYIYYHSAELTGTITETQFSLNMLALNVGSTITTGANIWETETVAVTNGVGSVLKTPVKMQTNTVYGWASYNDIEERVTFTNKEFTLNDTSYTGNVCVRYYTYDNSTRHMEINANMIPAVVRLVMRAGLYSGEKRTNKIGEAIFTIYKASTTGAFSISMTADGVATTPLNFRALAYKPAGTGCSTGEVYGTVDEVIYDANWYDDVYALAVVGGDFTLANGSTKMLDVRALSTNSGAFKPDYADLTFSATGVTVSNTGANKGTVTGATDGGTVRVTITSKTNIDTTVAVSDT